MQEGKHNGVTVHMAASDHTATTTLPHQTVQVPLPGESANAATGPDPYSLLLGALGACTVLTMRLYADRKGIAVQQISVHLYHERVYEQDCAACEDEQQHIFQIVKEITLTGDLTAAERTRILRIAGLCPVHKTLSAGIAIVDREPSDSGEAAKTE